MLTKTDCQIFEEIIETLEWECSLCRRRGRGVVKADFVVRASPAHGCRADHWIGYACASCVKHEGGICDWCDKDIEVRPEVISEL